MDDSKKRNVVRNIDYGNIESPLDGINFKPELKPEHIQKVKKNIEQELQDLNSDDLEKTLNNLFEFKSLKMEDNGLFSVDIKEIEDLNVGQLFNQDDISNDRMYISTESFNNIDGNKLMQLVKEFAHNSSKFAGDALDTIVEALEDGTSMSNDDFKEILDNVMDGNSNSKIDFNNDENQNALEEIKMNMEQIEAKNNTPRPAISQKARGILNG